MKVNTVLFDLDGTLINTNELIIASFLHTFKAFGRDEMTREDVIGYIGEPLIDTFRRVDADQTEAMVATYREHNHANHDQLVKQYDGVYETVATLHEAGYKLAIVTTKLRPSVKKGLTLSGLDQFFDVVATLDDVDNAKPHPEPIERALDQLGAKPAEALMVGDSPHDIGAGKNAGTKTAAVAWAIKGRDVVEQTGADVILEKMPDLLDVLEVNKQ